MMHVTDMESYFENFLHPGNAEETHVCMRYRRYRRCCTFLSFFTFLSRHFKLHMIADTNFKNKQALPSVECITQHKPLVYDFKMVYDWYMILREVKDTRRLYPGERYENQMKTVKRKISGHTSRSTKRVVKKIHLLKLLEQVKATGSSCGWTKDPDIKKRSGGLMTLVIVLVRRGNYGGVETGTQVRGNI